MLNLRVPAGIGDISWSYSKLANLGKDLNISISADNPQRSLPFVKLLPNVVKSCYDGKNFHEICDDPLPYSTPIEKFYDLSEKHPVNFALNRFLEAGHRIEKFMPDLPTNLHYEVNTTPADLQLAKSLSERNSSLIGIYTSNYHCITHWSGWHLKEWSWFISELHKILPKSTFVFLGAIYDKPFVDDLYNLVRDVPKINLCGETSIGQLLEVLKVLDYAVCYPSGIAVMCNVFRTPVFMFYPRHLEKLINSWPDEESIENKDYIGKIFCKPGAVFDFVVNDFKIQTRLGG